jgi:hypothetical protein
VDAQLHTFLTSAIEGNELYASYCRTVQIRRKDSQGLVGYKNAMNVLYKHRTSTNPIANLLLS